MKKILLSVIFIFGIWPLAFSGSSWATSYGIMEKVFFPFNSAKISKKYHRDLDVVLNVAREKYWEIHILAGANPEETNPQELARQRAEIVKAYLVEHGADPARLKIARYGDQAPIADPKTKKGKAMNRYVEFGLEPIWENMSDQEYKKLFGR